ncbi:MAG: 50S ribosomal protein L21e [Candidatus Asgardarchaeia archaeon]
MKKSKGYRSRTRSILRKHPRERGMAPLGRLLHEYSINERVLIKIDPSVHKGMPHKRYHGKIGVVKGFRGKAIIVSVKLGNKEKEIITLKEHLRPIGEV